MLNTFYKKSVRKSEVGPWVIEFLEELQDKNLPRKIRFCFGDEWYFIEGSNIIVIPFYLHSLAFAKRLQQKSCFVEGLTKNKFLKLLRHEYGHYFECLFQTRKKSERRRLFGKSVKYPKAYLPHDKTENYVTHLPNHYAQSHPDEDFAETFAVAMKDKSWQKKYPKKTLAYHKLSYVDQLISSHKGLKRRELDSGDICLPKQNYSLKRWMNENQKRKVSAKINPYKNQMRRQLAEKNFQKLEQKRLLEALSIVLSEKTMGQRNIENFIKPVALDKEIRRIRKNKAHYIPM